MNTETGEITNFMIAPAGYVISKSMSTASVYLAHRGGASQAIMKEGIKPWSMKANSPDYVRADNAIYCTSATYFHPYIMSVGKISSSTDPFAVE